jgi:mRNA (guanine-N7-)-methyltransferase
MSTGNFKRRGPPYNKNEKQNAESKVAPPILLNLLVERYYASNPHVKDVTTNHELEVKFGTKGVKPLTKIDYDSVIRKLKSLGFSCVNEQGGYLLRMYYEHLDKSGQFKESNIRTEVSGFRAIQEYCKSNDILKLIGMEEHMRSVKFVKKSRVYDNDEMVRDVNFNDFNFRVSYQKEEEISMSNIIIRNVTQNWTQTKKSFRYINRVTFTHDDLPINVDISIVKSSHREGWDLKKTYTTEESGVFSNPEVYEIELELDNSKIGPGTKFSNADTILVALRKAIKYVLMGLQSTNYPVSIFEQKNALQSYMKLLYGESHDVEKRIYPKNFIGPSSYTLQIENIIPVDDNMNVPNIRRNYVVTDKADGERHLMYISNGGKIYLINTNMNVIFTGVITDEKTMFNSLFDGELILHNKSGQFINLFAVFDVYYIAKDDVRVLGFMAENDDQKTRYRYQIIKTALNILKPKSIIKDEGIPMRIEAKKFYPDVVSSSSNGSDVSIFAACKHILTRVDNGLFEYNTDGLIFTPAFMGVGGDAIGKTGKLTKTTWEYSFKWKPPQYNTIDFLVVTTKKNGEDIITPVFQEGVTSSDFNEYKTIELRCGFNQRAHGYINPCQDVYDDKLPEFGDKEDDEQYKPVLFRPSNPYDPEAGICNIMLKKDDTGVMQMFSEDGEVFEDNTIVEFKYDMTRDHKWRWIPIHVRNDKTTELRQGVSLNFGNAYHVAESNWKSIHNPVTQEMIATGVNIPEVEGDADVYYNRLVSSNKTMGLRNFHNFIKYNLIKAVSKKGETLIDYACGKAGDFPKWIDAQLSFVFGIDKSKDNLENRIDGACARFLNYRKSRKHIPYALFVNGDSSLNIRNGSAMLNEKAVQITKAVFGEGAKDVANLGAGVARQYGKAVDGFNVSSCQFALHYFFENITTLQSFVRNLAECTKLGGYFIATSYDGKNVYNMLKNKAVGEGISIIDGGTKIWEVQKQYRSADFANDSSCLGYKIDVYQESINKLIPEFLVNYDYFTRVMENYGFQVIPRDEAIELGLPEGSGLFSDLYTSLTNEVAKNKSFAKEYKGALNMNANEKKISFLNRYVVYKKIRIVNAAKVILEETETLEVPQTEEVIELDVPVPEKKKRARKVKAATTTGEASKPKSKPKGARKLAAKLVIVEDADTTASSNGSAPTATTQKKKLVLQDGSDSD